MIRVAGDANHIVRFRPEPYYVIRVAGVTNAIQITDFVLFRVRVAGDAHHIVRFRPEPYYVIRVAGDANHIVGRMGFPLRLGRGSHSTVPAGTILKLM